MSRAFVKESDADVIQLPDRPVSPPRNLVTPQGLTAIECERARYDAAHAAAVAAADKAAIAATARELRYWSVRRATAQVIEARDDTGKVQFGAAVTVRRQNGDVSRTQAFRIVGEDEAEPSKGTPSHVSPLARALFGKAAGAARAIR